MAVASHGFAFPADGSYQQTVHLLVPLSILFAFDCINLPFRRVVVVVVEERNMYLISDDKRLKKPKEVE